MKGLLSYLLLFCGISILLAGCPSSKKPDAPPQKNQALVSGRVYLDPLLQAKSDPLSILFIMARNSQNQLVMVKKILPPFEYPLTFELTNQDQMIPGMEPNSKLKLSARLDKDGNANPNAPGDILGRSNPEWASLGSQDIKIILNEVVP